MPPVRYTLVTDGPSDRALLPVLGWLWRNVAGMAAQGECFDPRPLTPSARALEDRIRMALEFYPCEVLFVHRDAEGQPPDTRRQEILTAVQAAVPPRQPVPHVCVVPVRMTEAWRLFDEAAIRRAAGNPNGTAPLELPPLDRAEDVPDPKSMLSEAIRVASGLSGRRLKKLAVERCRFRLAELVRDFSPLRALPAFLGLEDDLRAVAAELGLAR